MISDPVGMRAAARDARERGGRARYCDGCAPTAVPGVLLVLGRVHGGVCCTCGAEPCHGVVMERVPDRRQR